MTPKQALDALANLETALKLGIVGKGMDEHQRYDALLTIILLRHGVTGCTAQDGVGRVETFVNEFRKMG